MKTWSKAALSLPLLTVALLSGCGSTTAPTSQSGHAQLSAQAATSSMKVAEVSGRIGAWAKGRIGAWAKGTELDASTRADGVPNTFSENLDDWNNIHLAAAQQLAPNLGNGVVVAVIDTGLDLTHPAFQGHLTASSTWRDVVSGDADPTDVQTAGNAAYGHGTAVADVVLQLAPNAKIMPIRALTADGSGSSDNLASAVNWAASHGARVINISATSNVDTTLTAAMSSAAAKGIYVTVAAGNESTDMLPFPARNASKADVLGQYALSIGAVGSDQSMPTWSNYGDWMEIIAPGNELATAVPGGYALASGTSFAAPVLAGTLALALGEPVPAAFAGQLAQKINATGTNIDQYNSSRLIKGIQKPLGYGLVNAQAFLQSLK